MVQTKQELSLLCCTDKVWQQDVVSWPSTHLLCDPDKYLSEPQSPHF